MERVQPRTLFVAMDDEGEISTSAVGFTDDDFALVLTVSTGGSVTIANVAGLSPRKTVEVLTEVLETLKDPNTIKKFFGKSGERDW